MTCYIDPNSNPIPSSAYIGNSLSTINNNFSALDTATCALSTKVTTLSARLQGALVGPPGINGAPFFAPTGTVALYPSTHNNLIVNAGWVACDGASYSTSAPSTSALYNVIFAAFGSSGAGYFNVPNINNGTIVVAAGTNYPVGTTGTIVYPAGTSSSINYTALQYYIKL